VGCRSRGEQGERDEQVRFCVRVASSVAPPKPCGLPNYRAATPPGKGAAHLVAENQSSYIWNIPEMGTRSVLIQWVFPELY